MLVVRDEAALRVGHLVGQAAGLAAIAPVGTAARLRVADVALAAVGHTQRTVDEELDVGAAGGIDRAQRLVHGGNLLHREFTRQHDLRQACVLQKTRFFGCANVGLGAGVQLDGGQVDLQEAHVLDDERIGTRLVHLPGHAARCLQLIIAQDGVERDENAGVEAVRVCNQALQIADVIARAGTGAKGGATDVHGIGAVVDGLDADVGVAGGGEQFDLVGQQRHGAIIPAPVAGRGGRHAQA